MPNMPFNTWANLESWLSQKGLFHIELGLGRIKEALAECGLAHPDLRIVQVLGTNGKGSTSVALATLAKGHGLKAGLFTSPHFLSPKERIRINGAKLEDEQWLNGLNRLARFTDLSRLTYFEVLTLLAIYLFADANIDIAILEAGLGGVNDATSALDADFQCFTPIAMDHAAIIGPTIQDIARDKAGAIKRNARVYSTSQFAPVKAQLLKYAEAANATLQFSGKARSGLSGKHQQDNAGLALAAWRDVASQLDISSQEDIEAKALQTAFLPGRLQQIQLPGLTLILDGAHNPHAVHRIMETCEKPPETIIYSALDDKDWRASIAMLLRFERPILIPQLANSRAARARDMAAYANRIRPNSATPIDTFSETLTSARDSALICGSLYLLAEFYKIYPQYLEKPTNGNIS